MSEITTAELINRLREHAEWAAANEYETPICLGDDLREAADRIEWLECELAAALSILPPMRNVTSARKEAKKRWNGGQYD